MPELPFDIWQARVNNEINILREMGVLEEDSLIETEGTVTFVVNITARGLVKDRNSNSLIPMLNHKIKIEINRKFPYPGGVKFHWLSEIFHPNIDPYETGYICLNVLKKWSQLSDLTTTIKALKMLVEHPNPSDPLKYPTCLEAAQYFFEHPPDEEEENDDILIID
ncbi:MAG: ubiquitin-conjugating enzyme E2 [Promethearchaeota archaeon]